MLRVLEEVMSEGRGEVDLLPLQTAKPTVQDSDTSILCHVLLLTVRAIGQMFVISRSFMDKFYHPFSGPLQFNNYFLFCLQARKPSLCQRHFYFRCHGPK